MTANAATTRWLTGLIKEHPVLGGLALMAIGILMVRMSMKDGEEKAAFLGGKQATGSVISLKNANEGSLPPKYQVEVRWYAAGMSHSAALDIFKKDYDRVKPGDDITLVLATTDPSRTILASRLGGDKPIQLAGITATSFVFVGLAMILAGATVAVFGQRLFADKPKPKALPRRLGPR